MDLTDAAAVATSVRAFAPDVVVHSAILNDWARMYADRQLAWDTYVEATRSTIDAADEVGAAYVLVSTDWVFDGTQGGADESTPPNPINLYGFLKFASEMVVLERGGAVGRVSGVNGLHRARPTTPPGGALAQVPSITVQPAFAACRRAATSGPGCMVGCSGCSPSTFCCTSPTVPPSVWVVMGAPVSTAALAAASKMLRS